MFRISLLCLFATAALAQTPSAGVLIMSGNGTLSSGAAFEFKTMVESSTKLSNSYPGGLKIDGNTVHRFLCDLSTRSYFGYDLVVESGNATTGYKVFFQPLSMIDIVKVMGRPASAAPLSPMPLPKYPAPQLVNEGDTIALDLMVSPDGQQKLVDYITVSSHQSAEPAAAITTAVPRDFTLDDGPLTPDFSRSTVWINGQKFAGAGAFSRKSGATFWFAFPGNGRYILSLAPRDGFQKAGTIRDNVITFQDGGQQYEVRLAGPIAGAGNAWNLYLLHDAAYKQKGPQPNMTDVVYGGIDRLESLLPKR
jgi:hypothetical protein